VKKAEVEAVERKELEEMIESILEVSKRKADEIISQAKEEAERIIKEAERRANRIIEAKKKEIDRKVKDEIAKKSSAVEIKIKREILTMQKRYLDLLFEKVREQLALIAENKLPEWNYEEILMKYAREAAEALGTNKLYIWGKGKDLSVLRKVAERLSKEMNVDMQVDVTKQAFVIGGVIARDEGDTRRFYNTFDGRLVGYRERNEPKLIDLLFGGSDE